MGRLTGKVAIVTGAASGMGLAQAKLFIGEGAKVALTDLSSTGQSIAESLGDAAIFIRHDVSSEDQWAAVVKQTEERFGHVDVLVNNAGVFRAATLEDTTRENFDLHVAVNQTGIYLGMRAAAAAMKRAGKGSIVNLSSAAGMRGTPGCFAYVASKWAVRGMTKAAAVELAPYGIRVNSVHPGVIETAMVKDQPPEWFSAVCSMTPLGRLGQAEEVAQLALYLSSDESSYTSGAEIAIDGAATA